jgi:hypothetical protein
LAKKCFLPHDERLQRFVLDHSESKLASSVTANPADESKAKGEMNAEVAKLV